MMNVFEPVTLQDAVSALDVDNSAVRPMGGGTALMLMMKAQLFTAETLVRLRPLQSELSGISVSGDGSFVRIGGATTFVEIERSEIIARYFPSVVEAMNTLANPRVRNVATVGGNLAYADPHLDLPPIWTSLKARVRILSAKGERVIPIEELFVGYYETTLVDGEIITAIEVPIVENRIATYVKITTRAAHDWATIGIAIALQLDGSSCISANIVLSAAVDHPTHLEAIEALLSGAELTDDVIAQAGDLVAQSVELESDGRGSAEYKAHLLRVHLQRALRALVKN